MKRHVFSTLLITLALALIAPADDIKVRAGEGATLRSEDGSATLNIGARIQVRHTYEENRDSSTFHVPRLRFSLKGKLYRDWKWEVQTDFAKKEKATLKDGFVERAVGDQTAVRFGQFKAGFDRQQLESSGRQTFVDRNIASNGLGKARDVGLQLHGRAMNRMLGYNVGLFNGAGEGNPSPNGGHMAVGRISLNPLGDFGFSQGDLKPSPAPRVYVDVAAYHSQDESGHSLDGTTGLATGAGFKFAGLYAAGEYFRKWGHAAPDADGFYTQASYMLLPSRFELAARYAQFNPDVAAADTTRSEITAGANVYFNGAGHGLKLTADVSHLTDEAEAGDDKRYLRSRVQFQLVF